MTFFDAIKEQALDYAYDEDAGNFFIRFGKSLTRAARNKKLFAAVENALITHGAVISEESTTSEKQAGSFRDVTDTFLAVKDDRLLVKKTSIAGGTSDFGFNHRAFLTVYDLQDGNALFMANGSEVFSFFEDRTIFACDTLTKAENDALTTVMEAVANGTYVAPENTSIDTPPPHKHFFETGPL